MQSIFTKDIMLFWREEKLIVQDLAQFLKRLATLLNEGYVLADCMTMLLPYHVKNFDNWQTIIQQQFQKGSSIVELFKLLGVKQQYLLAIQLAEINGELAHILQTISEQMQFDFQVKQRLQKLLTYPALLFIFLTVLFIGFRKYFLPNITAIFATRTEVSSVAGVQLSQFFLRMPDYIVTVLIILFCLTVITVLYIKRKHVDLQLQLLMRLPLIRHFWTLLLTRQFARSLSRLLLTGFSLQQALYYLKEQQIHHQISYVSHLIEQRVIYGDTLAAAVRMYRFFFPKFDQFIEHGEKSGLLARELMLYCELLDQKMNVVIEKTLQILQPLLFTIIAVCIVAAYLSILLPMYNLLDFI